MRCVRFKISGMLMNVQNSVLYTYHICMLTQRQMYNDLLYANVKLPELPQTHTMTKHQVRMSRYLRQRSRVSFMSLMDAVMHPIQLGVLLRPSFYR